jgi:hypothetical protein
MNILQAGQITTICTKKWDLREFSGDFLSVWEREWERERKRENINVQKIYFTFHHINSLSEGNKIWTKNLLSKLT